MNATDLSTLRFCILGLEATIERNRESIDSKKPNAYLSLDPSVFVQGYLYAFNCELLIKYLLLKSKTKSHKSHNPKQLFNHLPDTIQSKIERSIINFEDNLSEYSEYFKNQRYLYENKTARKISINVNFLYDLRESLHKITPEIRQINNSTAPKPSPAA